ncbi:MAG: hypothetical protein Q3999_02755 [Buchananella hordeovulneris]|nr:hypothetical protein [Buchananella hordeovulneris]
MISPEEWVSHLKVVARYAEAAGFPRYDCEDAVRCAELEPSEAASEIAALVGCMVEYGLAAPPELVEYIRPLAAAYDVIEEFAAEYLTA